MKKNNTWNIRRLVDDSFVSSAQPPSVNLSQIDEFFNRPSIYCREVSCLLLRYFCESCHRKAVKVAKSLTNRQTKEKQRFLWILWDPGRLVNVLNASSSSIGISVDLESHGQVAQLAAKVFTKIKASYVCYDLRSVNLQYNMLARWASGTNDSSTSDVPSIFFFIKSCKILCKNPLNLFFYFL